MYTKTAQNQTTQKTQEIRKNRYAGRIRRAMEDYQRRTTRRPHQGFFLASDCFEVIAQAREEAAGDRNSFLLYLAHDALKAGFSIGYRAALRAARQKPAPAPRKPQADDAGREGIIAAITRAAEHAPANVLELVYSLLKEDDPGESALKEEGRS